MDELITADQQIWRVGERGAVFPMNGFMVVNLEKLTCNYQPSFLFGERGGFLISSFKPVTCSITCQQYLFIYNLLPAC